MRSSILKLTGLIALTLVICIPSFAGPLYDNLGAQVADISPAGTGYGDIAQAQRFSVSDNNVDYTFSSNLLNSGWFTGYGFANLMRVDWDEDSHDITATLSLFNDSNGDVGLPTVSIYADVYNSVYSQPEPGATSLTTLTIDPAFLPFPNTLTNVGFTGNYGLTAGTSYWMVLTSPGPMLDGSGNPVLDTFGNPSLGVESDWAYTGAPEPMTLAMVGGALVLLSVRRKRRQK